MAEVDGSNLMRSDTSAGWRGSGKCSTDTYSLIKCCNCIFAHRLGLSYDTQTHAHTYTRTCMHTRTNIHARTHTHTHARAHTHARIHTHTHARARTHTHTHTVRQCSIRPSLYSVIRACLGWKRNQLKTKKVRLRVSYPDTSQQHK